jgi:hypothetical protein
MNNIPVILLAVSLIVNILLAVRLKLISSDLKQEKTLHQGTLFEKKRLREIIRKIHLN